MAYTISDAHTALAYRLGESAAPSSTTELARRLTWFQEAVRRTAGSAELMWFMQDYATDTTVEDKPYYDVPSLYRKMLQVKIDGYRYDELPAEDVYERFELPSSPVPIQTIDLDRKWYVWANKVNFIPIPGSAPDPVTVTIAHTAGVATATSSSAHGFTAGKYVTVAGADQSGYNGTVEILTVPSTTTFTYAVATATVSPATGTITATERNIEYWYYKYPTMPTLTTSSIVVPDEYLDMLVAYAEGRFWSYAHKRAKSADAFVEFETRFGDMKMENFRKKFGREEL